MASSLFTSKLDAHQSVFSDSKAYSPEIRSRLDAIDIKVAQIKKYDLPSSIKKKLYLEIIELYEQNVFSQHDPEEVFRSALGGKIYIKLLMAHIKKTISHESSQHDEKILIQLNPKIVLFDKIIGAHNIGDAKIHELKSEPTHLLWEPPSTVVPAFTLNFSLFYDEWAYELLNKLDPLRPDYKENAEALLKKILDLIKNELCSDSEKFSLLHAQKHSQYLSHLEKSTVLEVESEAKALSVEKVETFDETAPETHELKEREVKQPSTQNGNPTWSRLLSLPINYSKSLSIFIGMINEINVENPINKVTGTPEKINQGAAIIQKMEDILQDHAKSAEALEEYQKFNALFPDLPFFPEIEFLHAYALLYSSDFTKAKNTIDDIIKISTKLFSGMQKFDKDYFTQSSEMLFRFSEGYYPQIIQSSYEEQKVFLHSLEVSSKYSKFHFLRALINFHLSLFDEAGDDFLVAVNNENNSKFVSEIYKIKEAAFFQYLPPPKKQVSLSSEDKYHAVIRSRDLAKENDQSAYEWLTEALTHDAADVLELKTSATDHSTKYSFIQQINSQLYFDRGLVQLQEGYTDEGLGDLAIAIFLLMQQQATNTNPDFFHQRSVKLAQFYWIRSLVLLQLNRTNESINAFVQAKIFLSSLPCVEEDNTAIHTLCSQVKAALLNENNLQKAIDRFHLLFSVGFICKLSQNDLEKIDSTSNLIQNFAKKKLSPEAKIIPLPTTATASLSPSVSTDNKSTQDKKKKKKKKKKPEGTENEEARRVQEAKLKATEEARLKAMRAKEASKQAHIAEEARQAEERRQKREQEKATRKQQEEEKKEEKARLEADKLKQREAKEQQQRETKLAIERKKSEEVAAARAAEAKKLADDKIKKTAQEQKRAEQARLQQERIAQKEKDRLAKEKAAHKAAEEARRETERQETARQQALAEEAFRIEAERIQALKNAEETEKARLKALEEAVRLAAKAAEEARIEAIHQAEELHLRTLEAPHFIIQRSLTVAKQHDITTSEIKSSSAINESKNPFAHHLLIHNRAQLIAALKNDLKSFDTSSPEQKELSKLLRAMDELKTQITFPTEGKINIVDTLHRLETIEGASKAFVVGNIVRDTELGRPLSRIKRKYNGSDVETDVDLVAGLSLDKTIALEKLKKAFPEKDFIVTNNKELPELFNVIHRATKTKYQIINSRFLCQESGAAKYHSDPLRFDALNRDFYHNAIYADKDGHVYTPLRSTPVALAGKVVHAINKRALFHVENKLFDEKYPPEYHFILEDPRRLIRGLAFLATSKNITSSGELSPDFTLSDEFKAAVEQCASLLIPNKTGTDFSPKEKQALTAMNGVLSLKVFSRDQNDTFAIFQLFNQLSVTDVFFPGLKAAVPDTKSDSGQPSTLQFILSREVLPEHVYVTLLLFQHADEFRALCKKHAVQDEAFLTELEALKLKLIADKPLFQNYFENQPARIIACREAAERNAKEQGWKGPIRISSLPSPINDILVEKLNVYRKQLGIPVIPMKLVSAPEEKVASSLSSSASPRPWDTTDNLYSPQPQSPSYMQYPQAPSPIMASYGYPSSPESMSPYGSSSYGYGAQTPVSPYGHSPRGYSSQSLWSHQHSLHHQPPFLHSPSGYAPSSQTHFQSHHSSSGYVQHSLPPPIYSPHSFSAQDHFLPEYTSPTPPSAPTYAPPSPSLIHSPRTHSQHPHASSSYMPQNHLPPHSSPYHSLQEYQPKPHTLTQGPTMFASSANQQIQRPNPPTHTTETRSDTPLITLSTFKSRPRDKSQAIATTSSRSAPR